MKPLIALGLMAALPVAAAVCEARSGPRPLQVVELYTSEGCSSCPPADRWLSTLKDKTGVLPLAFHVNYWNRLGWADRFASTEATDRQYMLARAMGAPNVYTPQVIVQGLDWRRWPSLPAAPGAAPMTLVLQRDGQRATATVGAASGRWAAYWAVVEHGHRSRVTAGENHGETLKHDHVVRQYRPVAAWTGSGQRFDLDMPPAEAGFQQRLVFVVVDAASQRPVQALALDC